MSTRTIGWITLAAFVATVFAANLAMTMIGIVPVGFGLVAPAGDPNSAFDETRREELRCLAREDVWLFARDNPDAIVQNRG